MTWQPAFSTLILSRVQYSGEDCTMTAEDTGLQPLNLFMTLFPFLLSSAIVGVRIWKKIRERSFAAGIAIHTLMYQDLTSNADDLVIAIAQVLAIGLTVATWICRSILPISGHLS
jgi:hypothetical protein